MMWESFRGVKIYFNFIDKKSDVVNVFLHGWGCDSSFLAFCGDLFCESSLFVDFPPFGKSGKNLCGWTIFTYVNMLIWLCERLKIQKVNLVGHSFGGRVAILFSVLCKEKTNKLVLVDSAGIKPRRSLKYFFKVFSYKIRKKLKIDTSKCGSKDFLALSENQRETFKNIVSTHLDEFLPYIEAETLIIFGENDKTTPKYMARKLHRKIKNSELVFLKGAGHFPFVDCRLRFSFILTNFLNQLKNSK